MRSTCVTIVLLFFGISLIAQQTTQDLSKDAQNGALYDVSLSDDGSLSLVYGLMKKNETAFVNYTFSKDLKFIKEEESSEPKNKLLDQPSKQYEYIYTSVGGCSSFDVLSMSLNVSKISLTKTWNNKRQSYDTKMEESKIGNDKDDSFKYKGYVGYYDAENGKNLVLVKEDDKSKDDAKQYKLVTISLDGSIKELTIGDLSKYTLVFSSLVKRNPDEKDEYEEPNLAEYDALFIFAPSKNTTADPKSFVVCRFDGSGDKLSEVKVAMPAAATVITEMRQDGNHLYFFGMTSPKKSTHFKDEFMDFSNISNPCYPDFHNYRDNQREENITNIEPDNLVMFKMTGDNLEYITPTPASVMESKKSTPPSVKKAPNKPFSRFKIQAFEVFGNGDMLVAGQRTRIIMIEGTGRQAYEDLICFHFDSKGNLKAQYYVEPQLATQKDDKIFQMQHMFIPSKDNKNAYWIMYEPEGTKGYATFMDAYYGRTSIYASFQPVIMKIDLDGAKISDPELPLGKEFLSDQGFPVITSPNSTEAIFIGHTRKNDQIALTKYDFK